jgi:hypothetical protein
MSGSLSDYFAGLQSIGTQFANINSLSSADDALQSFSNLINGPAIVMLGSFAFQNFEVPETLDAVEGNASVLHKMPGGTRVLDDLGDDPDDISFSGKLLGDFVGQRKQQLAALKGQVVTLTWRQESRTVWVQKLDFSYNGTGTDFTCHLIVLQTNVVKPPLTLASALTTSLSTATGINIPLAAAQVTTAVNLIAPVLQTAVSLTGGSPAALKVLGVINTAQSTVNNVNDAAQGQIGGVVAQLASITRAPAAIAAINTLGSALSIAVPVNAVSNNLQVMNNNLSSNGAA